MTPAEAWTQYRPIVAAALKTAGGLYEVEDVERAIAEGRAHFWPGHSAVAVTEFLQYPRFRALNYWVLGGDLGELLGEMQPVIEKFAKDNGCAKITGFGRFGWRKVAEDAGFRRAYSCYIKELSDGR